MYFLPFAILCVPIANLRRNYIFVAGLGVLTSLMNDLFYGVVKVLFGFNVDLTRYFTLWLIPSGETLFHMDLGFVGFPVYSWMMASTIYLRVMFCVVVFVYTFRAIATIEKEVK
jgi:uncharacterized membrane protein YhdT